MVIVGIRVAFIEVITAFRLIRQQVVARQSYSPFFKYKIFEREISLEENEPKTSTGYLHQKTHPLDDFFDDIAFFIVFLPAFENSCQ